MTRAIIIQESSIYSFFFCVLHIYEIRDLIMFFNSRGGIFSLKKHLICHEINVIVIYNSLLKHVFMFK